MGRSFSAQGIVLKRTNFGEADRLVTFLSKYRGRFTAIAKGVRKITSRRSSNLELLNHVKAHFAQGKNFAIVTEAETVDSFKDIKEDLNKTSYGFHLAEITNGFLADGQGGGEVFGLLLSSLQFLKKGTDSKKVLRAFEIKFLNALGFRPQVNKCVRCEGSLMPETNFLSPEYGGVVHQSCLMGNLFAKPISANGIRVLRFLQNEDLEKIERLSIPANLTLDLEEQLKFYLEYLLEKELKSAKFINHLDRGYQTAF